MTTRSAVSTIATCRARLSLTSRERRQDWPPVATETVRLSFRKVAGVTKSPSGQFPSTEEQMMPRSRQTSRTRRFTARSFVAAKTTNAPSASTSSNARGCHTTRPSETIAFSGSERSGLTTTISAPATARCPALRAAIVPPPTTTHRRPFGRRLIGRAGSTRRPPLAFEFVFTEILRTRLLELPQRAQHAAAFETCLLLQLLKELHRG